MKKIYANFHKHAYTLTTKLIKRKIKTLDISTALYDDVAFVFFHTMKTFSEDFLEVSSIYRMRSCPMLRIFPQPPLFYYAAIVSVDQPIVMWSEPIV